MSHEPLPAAEGAPPRGRVRWVVPALVGVVAVALVADAGYGRFARWQTGVRGEHLSTDQARDLGLRVELPRRSADVSVYQHTRPDLVVAADFLAPEDEFRAWAAARGWPLAEIADGAAETVVPAAGGRPVDVRRGLTLGPNPVGPDVPAQLVYDRQAGRGYYWQRAASAGEE